MHANDTPRIHPTMKTAPRSSKSARTTRRKRNDGVRVATRSAPPPLPILSIPHNGETVIAVTVLDDPITGKKGVQEWVADEPPSRRLGQGQLVMMKNTSGVSGPGLLTAVTDLRRHWVTWAVSGGPGQCRLSVPIPWSAMTGVEAIAHAKHYQSLPELPVPHHRTLDILNVTSPNKSPYDLALNPEEIASLESRLDEITQRQWEWRPESERKRRIPRRGTHDTRTERKPEPANHASE